MRFYRVSFLVVRGRQARWSADRVYELFTGKTACADRAVCAVLSGKFRNRGRNLFNCGATESATVVIPGGLLSALGRRFVFEEAQQPPNCGLFGELITCSLVLAASAAFVRRGAPFGSRRRL